MSKKKRNERKKIERKEKSIARVVSKRKKLREIAKDLDNTTKMKKHFEVKMMPIRNNKNIQFEEQPIEERKDEWIRQRLEHNMKILEALEEEIKKEDESRQSLHQSLEERGANDMDEKLKMMSSDAIEIMKNQNNFDNVE